MLAGLALGAVRPHGAAAQQGPYDSLADAHRAVASALDSARADHKLVLLDFGGNWCLDCLVLQRFFEEPGVESYLLEHYHLVDIDVGNFDRNRDISLQYDDPITGGVPAVVVLRPDGSVVATTKDGALESARNDTVKDILRYLRLWVSMSRARS